MIQEEAVGSGWQAEGAECNLAAKGGKLSLARASPFPDLLLLQINDEYNSISYGSCFDERQSADEVSQWFSQLQRPSHMVR